MNAFKGRNRKIHSQQFYNEEDPSCIHVDRVLAMKRQEQNLYQYRNYAGSCSSSEDTTDLIVWREKICHWTFSVIDHFDLSRETVATSLNLFDRFLATRANKCDGNFALLTSLTTLYIAIKVREKKKIKLSTLTQLSRGQFGPCDIEEMEMSILTSLQWLVHPPTVVDFICHLLKFLPPDVKSSERHNVFELSRYLAELSTCDPFFIEYQSSTIAFAAILNVLEDQISLDRVPCASRERFFRDLQCDLNFHRGRASVRVARDRLQTMLLASGIGSTESESTSTNSSRECATPASSSSRRRSSDGRHQQQDKDESMMSSIDSASADSKGRHLRSDSLDSKDSTYSQRSRGSRGRFFRSPRSGSMVTPC